MLLQDTTSDEVVLLPYSHHFSRPHETVIGVKKHMATVKLVDLRPIHNEANCRERRPASLQTKVRNNATSNELFSLMSHSPTIFARRVDQLTTKGKNCLLLHIPKGFLYGIADGQNLLGTVLDATAEIKDTDPRVLDLVIIEDAGKFSSEVKAQLSETLNTSMSQKAYSVLNFLNVFDWIKDALYMTKWEGYWKFKEQGEGKENVENLLKMLIALNSHGDTYTGVNIYNNGIYKELLQENPQALDVFADVLVDIHNLIWMLRLDSYEILGSAFKYHNDASERGMFTTQNQLNETILTMVLYTLRPLLVMDLTTSTYRWSLGTYKSVESCIRDILPNLLAEIRNRPSEEIDPRSYARSRVETDRAKMWKAHEMARKADIKRRKKAGGNVNEDEDDVPQFKRGKNNWDKLADKFIYLYTKKKKRALPSLLNCKASKGKEEDC